MIKIDDLFLYSSILSIYNAIKFVINVSMRKRERERERERERNSRKYLTIHIIIMYICLKFLLIFLLHKSLLNVCTIFY